MYDPLDVALILFPGRLKVTPREFGKAIGWEQQTVYNHTSKKTKQDFPAKIGDDGLISIIAVAEYLALAAHGAPTAQKKKRGRPLKQPNESQQTDAQERAELERQGQQRLEVVV